MGTRRALRTGRPGRPADRAADPAQANRRQLAVLAGQPPKRTPPPPPPNAPTTAYRVTLGRIAQESYRLAAETVLAEVRRLQAMAEAYRADTEEDDKRAAEQNKPHTPEEKEALDVPESLDDAIVVLERRAKSYAEGIDTDKITTKHAKQIEAFNRGVTLRVLGDLGLNPIPDGNAMAKARDAWVKENAALIVSQPLEVAERCGQVVREMVPGGSRWETIAKRLEEEQGIATRRAALIARDQVSKYNAELTKIQQKGAGIEYYMWQGAMDNRERPSHVALQGTVWSWDRPPPVGSPGEPIQCRCWASPVTSDDAKKFAVAWTPEELAARTAELGPTQREGPDATPEQVAKRASREVAAEVKLAQRRVP
jgi:SPP1 gp7 family putative phage head morphogenesis protein